MDETLSRVALDLSGRAFLVFNADFPSQKIGAFDTELVREWFQAFAMNAGVTLHAQRRCTATTAIISPRACSRVWPAPCVAPFRRTREEGRVPSTKGTL